MCQAVQPEPLRHGSEDQGAPFHWQWRGPGMDSMPKPEMARGISPFNPNNAAFFPSINRAPLGYAPVPSRDLNEERVRTESEVVSVHLEGSPTTPDPELEREHLHRKAEQQASVFDTYAICSAILTGFSCSAAYMSVTELQDQEILHFIITNIQQWLVRICTAMGIYSVLVFAFCAMYARSCLARPGKLGLEIYKLFMKRTGRVRVRAFYNMYSMAMLYGFSVVLSCWISFGHLKALVASVTLIAVLVITAIDTNSIINVAGLIYAPDDVVQAALAESAEMEEEERLEEERKEQEKDE